MVRWMSGRSQLTANESDEKSSRGFESRPHRFQTALVKKTKKQTNHQRFYGSVAVRWNTGPSSRLERPDTSGRSGVLLFGDICVCIDMYISLRWTTEDIIFEVQMILKEGFMSTKDEKRFQHKIIDHWNCFITNNTLPNKKHIQKNFG